MVHDDLARISRSSAMRLRIFTSESGRTVVPTSAQECVLPYDDRLETLRGFDGTRSEFPQRALRHFVECLNGHELELADACTAVANALRGLGRRSIPERERKTDEQIASLLHEQWVRYSGSSTRLHRFLRDEALIACEQRRFRDIWRRVREDRLLHVGVLDAA
jgi:hypothetical protein